MNNEISEDAKEIAGKPRAINGLPSARAGRSILWTHFGAASGQSPRKGTYNRDVFKMMYKRIAPPPTHGVLREAQNQYGLAPLRPPAGFAQDDPGGEDHSA
jgi:hypothetical protein